MKNKTFNVISGIIVTLMNFMIGFFLSPYILNHLGKSANGYIQLANNFIMYASLFTVALNSMAGRFISICYYKNDKKGASQFYSSVIIGNLILLIIMLPIFVWMIINLDKLIVIDALKILDVKLLFSFVFLSFFLETIISIFKISVFVKNLMYLSNLANLLRTILRALLLIVFFKIFKPKLFFVSLIGFVIALLFIIIWAKLKNHLISDIKFNHKYANFKYAKKLVVSGIWNSLNQTGNVFMTGLDLLLANIFINPIQMGIFAISKTIPNSIINLASVLNSNTIPQITIFYAKGDKEAILKEIRNNIRVSTLIITTAIIVFNSYAIQFYNLWMPSLDSRKLAILSILTCMAYIPCSGVQVLYNIFTVKNKLKFNTITFLLSGLLNIILVICLLKYTKLGIYALAGASSVITILRQLIFVLPYIAKLLDLNWYEFYKDVLVSLIDAFCIFLICLFTSTIIPCNTWFFLLLNLGLSIITSIFVQFFILFTKNQRKYIFNKVRRRII